MEEFFDIQSENLSRLIPKNGCSRCMINLNSPNMGHSYITCKILNKYNKYVNINIQAGRAGIVLEESLFDPSKDYKLAYIITFTNTSKKLVRKLPVEGFSDWLLIYDDILFREIIKGGCEELEIIAV